MGAALFNKLRSGSRSVEELVKGTQFERLFLTFTMADEGSKGRAASNVFTKLPKKTMQEMKEAFTMIDQNRDGVIDIEDLKDMYSNLGRIPPDDELKEMLKEAPGPSTSPCSSTSSEKNSVELTPKTPSDKLSPCSTTTTKESSQKSTSRTCSQTWETTSHPRRSSRCGKKLHWKRDTLTTKPLLVF